MIVEMSCQRADRDADLNRPLLGNVVMLTHEVAESTRAAESRLFRNINLPKL